MQHHQTLILREATEQELAEFSREGYETWGAVLEVEGIGDSGSGIAVSGGIEVPVSHQLPVNSLSPKTQCPAPPKGQIFLSRAFGQVFGHNTFCNSPNPNDAARLWFRARKKAREWGADSVWIHFTDDFSMLPFWERLGFKPEMIMYRGSI
jgi:hypothetical protein